MRKLEVTIEERVLHFKQPAGTSRGIYTERKSWFVKVTDGGRCGVGECAPLPDLSCDALPNYGEVLRRFCDELERTGQLDVEALRAYPSMLFGLETALLSLEHGGWDAEYPAGAQTDAGSQSQGAACHAQCPTLFDTAFSRGEVGIPINGLVWMGTYEEMLRRMEEKLDAGFRCVKLKIGAIDFEQELELVSRIRQRFSRRELELRLDANGAFTFEDALYRLELLSQYAVHSIEQPIKPMQWSYMAELCRESPLPIALDEELIRVNDPVMKSHLLWAIKPAYIVLKPSLHGGMHGCEEWIAAAREQGVGSWVTSALESNVGLNAVAQFCSHVYGDHISMPQGLGTGQLFTDNISLPLEIRGDKLWMTAG